MIQETAHDGAGMSQALVTDAHGCNVSSLYCSAGRAILGSPSQQALFYIFSGTRPSMKHSSAIRLYAAVLIAIIFAATPAQAQFQPRPLNEPATGEIYHVEAAAGLWFPNADVVVASERFGIEGTTIDFKTDLGLQNKKLPDLRLVLTPSRRHKFRFEFLPIKYEQTATLRKDVVFNGIRYRLGLPVNSTLNWKAYRIGYEFDFVAVNRGFAGFVVEAKYTDVDVELISSLATEFARARAPIPAIGGIGRFYVVPNISITGEFSGFKLPENVIEDSKAHYWDFDLYGTVNFNTNVGAQVGYRSLDVGYLNDSDTGTFRLNGMYVGIVARY